MEKREIKFRGKWIQDGSWVEGFYYQTWNQRTESFNSFISHWRLIDGEMEHRYFQVKSESVGQFTGLLDKNKTPIYEGDILRTHWNHIVKVAVHNFRMCLLAISPELRERCHHFDFVDILTESNADGSWTGETEAEVIGNIFENSDLLTND